MDDLHVHIDRDQLTSDLGGTFPFSVSEWIQHRAVCSALALYLSSRLLSPLFSPLLVAGLISSIENTRQLKYYASIYAVDATVSEVSQVIFMELVNSLFQSCQSVCLERST